MKKNLLLIGSSGFIGIHLLLNFTEKHRQEFDKVISIDKMGYATEYNSELYYTLCSDLNISTINENINNLHNYKIQEGEWVVLNLASESHVDNSIKDPYYIFNENSKIPSSILSIFDDINRIIAFYHISTDEVYGDLHIDSAETDWFTENSKICPSSPYAASKASQDLFLGSLKRTYKFPVHIMRLANQIGTFQHPEKFIPISCLRGFKDNVIKIYGNGTNKRQWTLVDITVKIILDKVIHNCVFDVLHIADKNGLYDNNYIAYILKETISLYTGCTPEIVYIQDRLGHDQMYALKTTPDIDQHYKDTKIDEIISNIVEFYFTHKEEYKYCI